MAPRPINLAGHGQHESDGVLGQGVGVDAGGVGDGDAAGLAGDQVHVVSARAPDGDEAQLRAGGQHAVGEAGVRADVEGDLGVADALDQGLLLIGPALGEHAHLAQLLEWRLGHGAGQGGGKVIGDDDLHVGIARHRASPCGLNSKGRFSWLVAASVPKWIRLRSDVEPRYTFRQRTMERFI